MIPPMFSWNRPGAAWPPEFRTYESFKKEIESAIDSHPPFGAWLLKYRNERHVIQGGSAFEGLDVETLQLRYIEEEKKRLSALHARQYLCEYHIENSDISEEEIKRAQCRIDKWKTTVLEKQAKMPNHVIYDAQPTIEAPVTNRMLLEKVLLNIGKGQSEASLWY
jgi:hypothetical protein